MIWRSTPGAEPEAVIAGCGGVPQSVGAHGVEVRLVAPGAETPSSFTRLDDNVMVRTGP